MAPKTKPEAKKADKPKKEKPAPKKVDASKKEAKDKDAKAPTKAVQKALKVQKKVVKGAPNTPMLDYARQVEQITTKKKPNLILNVDGCIALCFVDLLRHRYQLEV